MRHVAFEDPQVAAVFGHYPAELHTPLMALRQLIFETAARTEGVGKLEETLKWGQPAYLTNESKSGSTIRLDQIKSRPGKYALYFHCQTTLVDSFREMYPDEFDFEKNRALIMDVRHAVPHQALGHCIAMALTYHLNRN